jgi:4-hydroxybenzoate polyprenyltransferase
MHATDAGMRIDALPLSPAARRRLQEWMLLTRFDRPIGWLLLLWPILWALWIAARGLPSLKLLVVFGGGTILTRSAGCIINDFFDRDFDPQVQRTRTRPLAARRISPYEALGLFAALMLVALLLALQLDFAAVELALVAAALMVSYPLCKRFFPAPQVYLGMAFGWGVPMAFVATTGTVPRVGWLIFVIAVVWATIYDTFYAMVDRDDDRRIGLRSTALLFGEMDLYAIAFLQCVMLAGLWFVGEQAALGLPYRLGLAVAAALFARQLWRARRRERERCFEAFLDNNHVGLVIFVGIVVDFAVAATAQH